MEVTEVSADGLKREFKIVVPAADIEQRLQARLTEISTTMRMPGFRPGKVPAALLRKTHGKAVLGEVLEVTVGETSQSAMTERDLRPVSQPKIEITEFDDGGDLEYKMELELFPEIKLVDLSSLSVERLKIAPDESQIDEAVKQMAEGYKDSKPLEESRAAATGDITVIDFVGSVDGEEFAGGKADGYSLELGSGSFIPGFEDQIVGANIGDHLQIKVTFPENYAENLASKDAVFEVDLKEIRETVPATIDDEFAKKLGAEDLASLRTRLGEEQGKELDGLARMRVKRELLDKLDSEHEFELPQGMVDAEFDSIWEQLVHQREHHPDQTDEEDKDKSDDELKEQYREIAARRVRLGLLLAEIGRINEIQVTSDEVNRAMVAEAQRYQGHEKEVLDYYKENPEALQALQSPILEEKVVDFILELADVTDRDATLEELIAEAGDGDGAAAETESTDKDAKKKKATAAKGAKKATKSKAKDG